MLSLLSHLVFLFQTNGCGSKPCTPGEHPNRWQMDVHPPQNGAMGSAWPDALLFLSRRPSESLSESPPRALGRRAAPCGRPGGTRTWQPVRTQTRRQLRKNILKNMLDATLSRAIWHPSGSTISPTCTRSLWETKKDRVNRTGKQHAAKRTVTFDQGRWSSWSSTSSSAV